MNAPAAAFPVDRIVSDHDADRAYVLNLQIKNGANRMLTRSAREGVTGASFSLYRPFQDLDRWRRWEDMPAAELLQIAVEKSAAMRNLGRSNHWAYSYSAHCAWREASIALRLLARSERCPGWWQRMVDASWVRSRGRLIAEEAA